MNDLTSPAGDCQSVRDPPHDLLGSLKYLGPGLILSAAIVGSGELIATTSLGAQAGFVVLWVILLGCVIKLAIQLQYGRHAIAHGKTSFAAWNAGRGPHIAGLHWSVYLGLFYLIAMLVGQGGVLGGAAQAAQSARPSVRIEFWVALVWIAVGLLVFRGKYQRIETIATLLNAVFVTIVVFCVYAVQTTQLAFGLPQVAQGLSLTLPPETLPLAVTAFSITGLSAGEIFVYPTWCIEKGYAAWTGVRDDSPEWTERAKGWIRVMQLDSVVSMIIYTVATVAFYFLGAAVLHAQGEITDGPEVIGQLSRIFTDVLGYGTMALFMCGAFTVLFSTAFANTAGHARLWIDLLETCGWHHADDLVRRRRLLAVLAWMLPGVWSLMYLLVREPIALIIVMGIGNAVFLLVVAYQGLVYRYRSTPESLRPSPLFDGMLWLSILTIGVMAARIAWGTYAKFASQ